MIVDDDFPAVLFGASADHPEAQRCGTVPLLKKHGARGGAFPMTCVLLTIDIHRP